MKHLNTIHVLTCISFPFVSFILDDGDYTSLGLLISICLNLNHILSELKRNYMCHVFKLFLIITLVKYKNPFSHLVLFWLPFPSVIRGYLVYLAVTFAFNRGGTEDFPLRDVVNHELRIRKTFWIVILIAIKLIAYLYDSKIYVHVHYNSIIPKGQKYFIAANLFNNESIIVDWITQINKFIEYLGPGNVYVSIMENGDSRDNTREYLDSFRRHLDSIGVKNTIITDRLVQRGNLERIQFLAKLRNYAIEPMYHIEDFDYSNTKIIFFNDIIFNYEDILRLIITNKGDYDLACGLDFYESFYDTWVAIGPDGHSLRHYFPYFINKEAQDRLIDGKDIRLVSCWNGVVSIRAEPFKERKLKFRHSDVLRQSECTLLCVDMHLMGYSKVILNPNVKVAYEYEYYYKNKYIYFWSKDLVTYFYYYFRYISEVFDCEYGNLRDSGIKLHSRLDEIFSA